MFNLFKKNESKGTPICSVASGKLEKIEKSIDPVFSQKMMGDGLFIKPTSDEIVSPIDGEVVMMFPTLHAIGLKDEKGNEYLIHIGIETAALNGEGFKSFVQVNEKVKKGQLLITADFEAMKGKITSSDIILLATDGRKCNINKEKDVTAGEENIASFE
ncbi:PTS glucose transporter subunit IIA [Anaerorhabdus sp.]|uniref:PTS sugar transporter subunit IIA n=1 Tax=Anaerorhabdus sp. TaxID=1872524 RepID=UPI002B20BF5C|nr:PTS glucose transporter subunit IIA [Anaerorhabdus sp.]MEA4875838.1 PTS glucose transporter subunit IIA [Anaerorhabdus sp.]